MSNKNKAVALALAASTLLWVTGGFVPVAGAITTAELQAQINVLMAQITALQAQLSSASSSASTSYTFTKDLTRGSKGADVTALQQMLVSGGYLKMPTGVAYGYFGPLTKAAVAAWQTAKGISPTAGYFGPKSRAAVAAAGAPAGTTGGTTGGTTTTTFPAGCTSAAGYSTTTGLLCSGTTTTTPVAQAPLTVQLASDTPVGGNILMGSANNVVTKLVFTAGNDADAKITGLTVKSYGTAGLNQSDIANVKMFDGTTQVGLTQTQVQGISTFTFAPALTITKGTSKTLSVVVDVANVAPAAGVVGTIPSATIKMGIESAAKILGGTTFTGTFPVVGNSNVIVAGGSIGILTVTPGAPVAVNNTYIGAVNVVLGNYIVTAGTNEDVKVTQFRVSYGVGTAGATASTIQDSDISNLRVQVDGANIGVPATFATRRASIDLTTPIILTKGTSKIFTVVGDVVSGANRVIELDNAINSVNGVGVTSGVGVTGGGAAGVTNRLGATSAIAIGAGQLSISVSTSSPAGASAVVVRSITPQVLGVYDVRAVGEDMLVNTVRLHFTALPDEAPLPVQSTTSACTTKLVRCCLISSL